MKVEALHDQDADTKRAHFFISGPVYVTCVVVTPRNLPGIRRGRSYSRICRDTRHEHTPAREEVRFHVSGHIVEYQRLATWCSVQTSEIICMRQKMQEIARSSSVQDVTSHCMEPVVTRAPPRPGAPSSPSHAAPAAPEAYRAQTQNTIRPTLPTPRENKHTPRRHRCTVYMVNTNTDTKNRNIEGSERGTQHTFEKHEDNISEFESTIPLLHIVNYYGRAPVDIYVFLNSYTVHVERYSQQGGLCFRIPS